MSKGEHSGVESKIWLKSKSHWYGGCCSWRLLVKMGLWSCAFSKQPWILLDQCQFPWQEIEKNFVKEGKDLMFYMVDCSQIWNSDTYSSIIYPSHSFTNQLSIFSHYIMHTLFPQYGEGKNHYITLYSQNKDRNHVFDIWDFWIWWKPHFYGLHIAYFKVTWWKMKSINFLIKRVCPRDWTVSLPESQIILFLYF